MARISEWEEWLQSLDDKELDEFINAAKTLSSYDMVKREMPWMSGLTSLAENVKQKREIDREYEMEM
ncbi:hypothetical protein [Candidatus Aciduliprofundum boonei]|uniref:Uncharacterized protein n=1 Tax=Aciduliprofundum boonei (strain DSM 19572 / T469) TaxID=439481 RepID=B5IHL8_ACIB4|nr:hypothetical protein [Candidatus Aciduliprofundum boonei]ADD08809.1 hypothetical protein Aboo_1000 [Aciduliprofundum boonei T469]EDY34223.1 hypothetical protein ABOONEI_2449 [Aciduliprofundum boonei T469]HII55418.1 hypothetical protein [Candidatus Aciduliprofundum boonei]